MKNIVTVSWRVSVIMALAYLVGLGTYFLADLIWYLIKEGSLPQHLWVVAVLVVFTHATVNIWKAIRWNR